MLLVKDSTTIGKEFFTKSTERFDIDEDQINRLQQYRSTVFEYMESKAEMEKFKENKKGAMTLKRMALYHNKRTELYYECQRVFKFLKAYGDD